MYKERWHTRDLLLEYNSNIIPPKPCTTDLSVVYPWENISLNNLTKQLYVIAANSGYIGTEHDFKTQFGSYLYSKEIIFDTFTNFPQLGDSEHLYFDLEEKILYYWDNGYEPINTLLIEGTILNAGSSTD